jgi:hypothetical protein
MILKVLKKIPKFETEAEKRRFWQNHDSSEYLDGSDGEKVVVSRLRSPETASEPTESSVSNG